MVSGIEGVGEAVTGGMIARAVEPKAGEAGDDHSGNCLNCGAELTGPYCRMCGQQGHVHRTLGAFWHDLAHSVLHFEGKIWRTLPMLAWRPGELTRRYIAGERARFVSPMAIFLFSVFLMFATFSLVGGPFTFGSVTPMTAQARAEAERDFEREQAGREAALDRRRAERARLAAAGQSTAAIDSEISGTERGLRLSEIAFRRSLDVVAVAAPEAPAAPAENASGGDDDQLNIRISERPSNFEWINRAYRHARENPSLLIYKLETNAYKFSWALIPISLPFLWLLFLHRRRYRQQYKAYDHIVFITYSIAFMSLGLIALSLLRPLGIGTGFMVLAIFLVPPVHIFRQLRGAYQLSVFSALWRSAMLLFFAVIAAMLFFVLLMLLGVLG
ncbi:MAG TPA: DUF3667 domain-containing protein [Allosphingosinicella sp.]|jgi:hypothetical protein